MELRHDRNFRDSMFKYMFSIPELQVDLVEGLLGINTAGYSIKQVTLEPLYAPDIQNDLGLQVGEYILMLVEAQSTVPSNIAIRMLEYYAHSAAKYIDDHDSMNLYSGTQIVLPVPKLFVVYTGDKTIPERYRFLDHTHGEGDVNLTVGTLSKNSTRLPPSLASYVGVSQFVNLLVKNEIKGKEFIHEVYNYCLNDSVLGAIARSNQEEVREVLSYEERNALQRRKDQYEWVNIGREEGIKEGRESGIREGLDRAVKALVANLGISVDEARKMLDTTATTTTGRQGVSKMDLSK